MWTLMSFIDLFIHSFIHSSMGGGMNSEDPYLAEGNDLGTIYSPASSPVVCPLTPSPLHFLPLPSPTLLLFPSMDD